jgi:small subunit ribosomal protein S9
MADDRTPPTPDDDEQQPQAEQPQGDAPQSQPAAEQPEQRAPAADGEAEGGGSQPAAEQPAAEQQEGAVEETAPASEAGTPGAPGEVAEPDATVAEVEGVVAADVGREAADDDEDDAPAPREKPAIPGADLEVDIVTDRDRLGAQYDEDVDPDAEPGAAGGDEADVPDDQPIAAVEINLSADARYRATGKRKTAVARVTLRPGTGAYTINGKPLDDFFPRPTLQRTIRQPLETVGYDDRMDVVARMHGGGVSAQAGALRHGISRALLEADPNLRTELKRRGFLTRDSRVKERKKAGLKKARKRPQFSKR